MRFAQLLSAGILVAALPAACGAPDEASTDEVERAVLPVGTPPVNTVPGPQSINEDTPLLFGTQMSTSFAITDTDSPVVSGHVVVTDGVFSVTVGVGACLGLTVSGSSTSSVTITGAPSAVAGCLNTGQYAPAENFTGAATLSLNTSDSDGNSDVDTVAITVNPVNDPPTNVVPSGVQGAIEDTPRAFSTISVQDIDVTGLSMIVTLTASNGSTMTLSTTSGLVFSIGDGSGNPQMRFTGTLPNINSALNGMTVTPAVNFIGNTQLTITSNDQGSNGSGGVGQDTDTVNIDWGAVNDAPVNSVPSARTTAEEVPFTFTGTGVALSVSDVDATVSLLQVTLSVSGGTLTLGNAGAVNFTSGDGMDDATMTFTGTVSSLNTALNNTVFEPAVDFVGAAVLTINTNDQGNSGSGGPQQDTDSVTINVTAVNDAPVTSVPVTQTTPEDTFVVFSAGNNNLISVADVDAPSLQVTLTAAGGTVTLAGTGGLSFSTGDGSADASMTFLGPVGAVNAALNGLRFDPGLNFNGSASLTVLTSDLGATGAGGTRTDSAQVTISVTAVNDAPSAVADAFTVLEDSAVANHDLRANDTTVDSGEALTITAVTNPAHGMAAIVGTEVSYVPDADYAGPDSFSYTITDPGGLTSAATVTVTVTNVNDLPTARNDAFTFSQDSSGNLAQVLANDTFAPDTGETLAVTSFTQPLHGTTAASGTTGVLYTPTVGFHGADSFTYSISDGNGGTASATVTITVTAQNAVPSAGDDILSVNEDASGVIPVLLNDTPGNDPITLSVVTPPQHGIATVVSSASISYTPTANFNGTDTFRYQIKDADGETSTALVTVTVVPQDDVPQAFSDSKITQEDTAVVIQVLANDTGLFDGTPVVTVVTQPAAGTGTATSSGPPGNTITFTPAPNYNGPATFQYQVADGDTPPQTSRASVNIEVQPVNDAPVAVDDSASTNIDMPIDVSVLANDTDPDVSDELTVTMVTVVPSAHAGTATVSADGKTIHYVPKPGDSGRDTLQYTIRDIAGLTANAQVLMAIGLDTDHDGLLDTEEDLLGTDPANPDSDDDGILDGIEVNVTHTLATDSDMDDDGLLDSNEDKNQNGTVDGDETDATKGDTDADGLQDGTEEGLDAPERTEHDPDGLHIGTNLDVFIPDVDPATTTDPRNPDTDGGGVNDGLEDLNHDGRVEVGETDPNDPSDDPGPPDRDFDGVPDATDNCPMTWNMDQADADGDGVGDECELPGDDGCGCRVGGQGGAGAPAAALLVLAGLSFLRLPRRRRRR
jgi:MYXO-CTERM domain-containing protein